MMPIRRGDGTGLSVPGFSEVRKGDGTVLWSAGADIPDSVVLQYYADSWSQGDSTWNDEAGTSDATVNGGPTAATLSDGSDSIETDGSDDHALATLPASLEGAGLESFSIEVAVQHTQSNDSVLAGVVNDNNQNIQLRINAGSTATEGQIRFNLSNGTDDLQFYPTNNPNLSDGNRHDVSIIINDSTTNDVDIIIDGSVVDVTVADAGSPSGFTSWDYDCALWSRNLQGANDNYTTAGFGAFRFHDSPISQQTINEYPQ